MDISLENRCGYDARNLINFVKAIRVFNTEHSLLMNNTPVVANKTLESANNPLDDQCFPRSNFDSSKIDVKDNLHQQGNEFREQEKSRIEEGFEKLWSDNKRLLCELGVSLVYNSDELFKERLSVLRDGENGIRQSLESLDLCELSFELEEDMTSLDYFNSAKALCAYIDRFSEDDIENPELGESLGFIVHSLSNQFLKNYFYYLYSKRDVETIEDDRSQEMLDKVDEAMEKLYQGMEMISDKFKGRGLTFSLSIYLDKFREGILKEYLIADSICGFYPHNWNVEPYEIYEKKWRELFSKIEEIKKNDRAIELTKIIYDKLSDCIEYFDKDAEMYSRFEEYSRKAEFINEHVREWMNDLAFYISARSN